MLGITNLLQDNARLFQVLRKQILLLGDFGKEDTKLITDVADGIILSALTPFAKLVSDDLALFGGLLVCADGVVLRLDELVELLRQFGLTQAAKAAHVKFVASTAGLVAAAAAELGSDG